MLTQKLSASLLQPGIDIQGLPMHRATCESRECTLYFVVVLDQAPGSKAFVVSDACVPLAGYDRAVVSKV